MIEWVVEAPVEGNPCSAQDDRVGGGGTLVEGSACSAQAPGVATPTHPTPKVDNITKRLATGKP